MQYQSGVNIKEEVFVEVFDLTMRMVTISVDGFISFWVMDSLWVVLPLLGVGLVYPKKVCHHPQRVVNSFKICIKVSNHILTPPQCLMNILA